jgi:hypothetical protein
VNVFKVGPNAAGIVRDDKGVNGRFVEPRLCHFGIAPVGEVSYDRNGLPRQRVRTGRGRVGHGDV